HQIGHAGGEGGQRVAARRCPLRRVPGFVEVSRHELGDVRIVLDDQDARGHCGILLAETTAEPRRGQPDCYASATPADVRRKKLHPTRQASRGPSRATVTSGRDWTKTALVIGGTTATGAGLGAISGGKKGALIGAAGGGAEPLLEVNKRWRASRPHG